VTRLEPYRIAAALFGPFRFVVLALHPASLRPSQPKWLEQFSLQCAAQFFGAILCQGKAASEVNPLWIHKGDNAA